MQEKLGIEIHHFAVGCDGGIDLCDNVHTKNVIVQVFYCCTTYIILKK